MRTLALILIRAYQLILSPILGPRCRFYPSCSHYASECFAHLPLHKAIFYSGWRLLRCGPWSEVAQPLFEVPIIDEAGKTVAIVEKGLWVSLKKKN